MIFQFYFFFYFIFHICTAKNAHTHFVQSVRVQWTFFHICIDLYYNAPLLCAPPFYIIEIRTIYEHFPIKIFPNHISSKNIKHHLHSRELYSQRLVNVGTEYSTQRILCTQFSRSPVFNIHFRYKSGRS